MTKVVLVGMLCLVGLVAFSAGRPVGEGEHLRRARKLIAQARELEGDAEKDAEKALALKFVEATARFSATRGGNAAVIPPAVAWATAASTNGNEGFGLSPQGAVNCLKAAGVDPTDDDDILAAVRFVLRAESPVPSERRDIVTTMFTGFEDLVTSGSGIAVDEVGHSMG